MTMQVACPADLSNAEARAVTLADASGQTRVVAIVRDETGEWFAIDDACTHGDVSLSEGDVGEGCIECWAHSAEFDLRTGEGTLPATRPVRTYPVQVIGDEVLVDLGE